MSALQEGGTAIVRLLRAQKTVQGATHRSTKLYNGKGWKMKQFSILSGKAHVVELPEGAANPEVHTRSLTLDTPMEVDEWGYDYQSVKLPDGNWQIVGRLSDVNWDESDIESLESAVVAEGYTFSNHLGVFDDFDKQVFNHSKNRLVEWKQAQSRVLCRERTLILRRVD